MEYANIKNHLITYSEQADQAVYVRAEGARFTEESGKTYINMNDISAGRDFSAVWNCRREWRLLQ